MKITSSLAAAIKDLRDAKGAKGKKAQGRHGGMAKGIAKKKAKHGVQKTGLQAGGRGGRRENGVLRQASGHE